METPPPPGSPQSSSDSDSDEDYFDQVIAQGREFNAQPGRSWIRYWMALFVVAVAVIFRFQSSRSSSSTRLDGEPKWEHRLTVGTYALPLDVTTNACKFLGNMKDIQQTLLRLHDDEVVGSVMYACQNGTLSRTPGLEEAALTLTFVPTMLNNSAERIGIGAALGNSISADIRQMLSVVQEAAFNMSADPKRALDQLELVLYRVKPPFEAVLQKLDSALLEPALERAAYHLSLSENFLRGTANDLRKHHTPPQHWLPRFGHVTWKYLTGAMNDYNQSKEEAQHMEVLAHMIGDVPKKLRQGKRRLSKYREKVNEQPLAAGKGWKDVVDLRLVLAGGIDDTFVLRYIAANYMKLLEDLDRIKLSASCQG